MGNVVLPKEVLFAVMDSAIVVLPVDGVEAPCFIVEMVAKAENVL